VGYTDGEMELTFDSGMTSLFKPANFHFHAPSEHTIDGQSYDLEVHFVHTYTDGVSLGAVIGVMFDRNLGGNIDNFFIDQMMGIWSSPNLTRISN
jgi:carbonic anhydrase